MFSQTHGFPFPQRRVEPLFAEGLAATGQAHAFPVPLCTSCADTGLTAQGSAAIIDLTRDSPRANDCTLQRNKVNTKRGAKVEDSAILPGNKRARGGSARMTVAAALGMVDQETVRIGCIQQKQSAVKTVGLLHNTQNRVTKSAATQPSCLQDPSWAIPSACSRRSPAWRLASTPPSRSTHKSLATDLKWPESQVIPSRQFIPCLAARQRLCPSIRTDSLIMPSFFKRHPAAQAILPACAQVRQRSRS